MAKPVSNIDRHDIEKYTSSPETFRQGVSEPSGPRRRARGLHGSATWFPGYHALSTLDDDLAPELEPRQPPQPFDDHT